MDCAVSAYINYLRIAGRANPALLAGSGNSDVRHTDKLFFANRTFIAALIAIKVLINIAPISMHRFAAALADIHIAALCTAYGTMVLLFAAAADAAGHGANRHFAIVGLPFQQRSNRISIRIVRIMVAVRRRFAVRFGLSRHVATACWTMLRYRVFWSSKSVGYRRDCSSTLSL